MIGGLRPRKRIRQNQRGIALIIAVISITVLTVVSTEFAYNSQVDLKLAANYRDDLRAYYLAKSGISLSRLLLRFQSQLDNIKLPAGINDALKNLGIPGLSGMMPTNFSIQLWRMAKVDCYMLQGLVDQESGGSLENDEEVEDPFTDFDKEGQVPHAPRRFGGFEGCFDSQISDEEEKININSLDQPGEISSAPVIAALSGILADKRFEFLFEKEDSNRVRVTPIDLIINLKDWVDEDQVRSEPNRSGQGAPLVSGYSDENGDYDRYNIRYKAKNARLDSLDELYMIHGVNDAFMAAFRDRLTVYPKVNAKLNVNSDDPLLLYGAILAVSDPNRPDPRLQNPVFVEQLIQSIRAARMFSVLGMTVSDFLNILKMQGLAVNPLYLANTTGANAPISDKSKTYSIKVTGQAGSIQKSVTAVVELDNGMGTLRYWKED